MESEKEYKRRTIPTVNVLGHKNTKFHLHNLALGDEVELSFFGKSISGVFTQVTKKGLIS